VLTDAAARALSGSMNSTCSAGPAPRIRQSKHETKKINGVELCVIKCEIKQRLSMYGCNCYTYIHMDTIAINIKNIYVYSCMVVERAQEHHALAKRDRSAPAQRELLMQDYHTEACKRP
jgi:hypothetical protein